MTLPEVSTKFPFEKVNRALLLITIAALTVTAVMQVLVIRNQNEIMSDYAQVNANCTALRLLDVEREVKAQ